MLTAFVTLNLDEIWFYCIYVIMCSYITVITIFALQTLRDFPLQA